MPNIIDISVSTGELPKFNKDKFERFIATLTRESGDLAANEIKSSIARVNAVASGQLLESITANLTRQSSSSYLVNVGSSDRAAEPIEEGLRPGKFPPVDVIYQWMIDKGIAGATRSSAYLIAQKLYKFGYEAKKPFEQAEERIGEKMDELIVEILNREEFF